MPLEQGVHWAADFNPVLPPYVPSGHEDVHVDRVKPVVAPYLPLGHTVQPSPLCPVTIARLVLPWGRYLLYKYKYISIYILNKYIRIIWG